jgi:hypothetical protein
MTKALGKSTFDRRQFLGVLGAGASTTVTVPFATVAVADSETNDEKRNARYQESEHIKTFYRVNRYPS